MPSNQRSRPAGALSGALKVLAAGEVEIQGRMPWSSNGTFLVTVQEGLVTVQEGLVTVQEGLVTVQEGLATVADRPPLAAGGEEVALPAIYKPLAGERPLWDFPDGLYRREVAAYELSEALGWKLVPETVSREDAPLGPGSLQRFVEADFEQHYFTLMEEDRFHPALKRMAIFDVIANNADRKGGHCLLDEDGHVWGIDHGLCFHTQPKLRTVIWDFAGEPLDEGDAADLARLERDGLPDRLTAHLHDSEAAAVENRVRRLLAKGRLPEPRSDRPYPWPLV